MELKAIFLIIISFILMSLVACVEAEKVETPLQASISFTVGEIEPFPRAVHGMVVDADSALYFSDSFTAYADTAEVYKLDFPYTGKPYATGIKGNNVSGLIWHNSFLYVAVLSENEVRKYDGDYKLLETWNVKALGT